MANENDPSKATEQAKNAEKLVKSETERLKVLKEIEEIEKNLKRLQQDKVESETRLKEIETERLKMTENQATKQEEILSQQEEIRKTKQQIQDIETDLHNMSKAAKGQALEDLKNLRKTRDDQQKILSEKQKEKREESKKLKVLKEQEGYLKRKLAIEQKYGKEAKDNIDNAEKSSKSFTGMFKDAAGDLPVIGGQVKKLMNLQTKIPGILNKVADNIGSIVSSGSTLGKVLGRFGAQGAVKGLSTVISSMAITTMATIAGITLFIGKIISMALEVNNLSKELGAATGFGDQFNEEITRMGVQGNLAGIGFKESADALKALTQGLSSFNPKAEKTNEYMGMTAARLEKLGVSAASSVKSMEHMQRSMGMTGKQAADTTAQLARMGKEIGITGTKMIEDFNSASGRLAIYGKNNIKVFKELAAAAKASGIEMQTLLGITEKFDKFDSAADSAAKLNAVLGTQLSTLEMMQATDSERILMLKQQVQMSVGNFDSLDKYTKQYIAQAMGVKDVAEAQKLLNMSMAEYQQYEKGQQQQADIQKELAEATEKLVPVMTQLKLAFAQFFLAFAPIIKGLATFLSKISPFIVMFGKALGIVAYGITIFGAFKLVVAALAMSFATFMVVSKIGLIITLVSGLVFAFSKLWDIIHKPGSRSMAEGMFDKDLGPTFTKMGKDASGARGELSALSEEMSNVYDAAHPGGKAMDIQAAASIDTSAIASGLEKVKSVLMELSTVKIDGFLAMTTDGTNSSFIMGSEGMIKNISEGKLVVDVKMPEMKMPDVSVKVYIGDRELRDIIRTETKAVIARAG